MFPIRLYGNGPFVSIKVLSPTIVAPVRVFFLNGCAFAFKHAYPSQTSRVPINWTLRASYINTAIFLRDVSSGAHHLCPSSAAGLFFCAYFLHILHHLEPCLLQVYWCFSFLLQFSFLFRFYLLFNLWDKSSLPLGRT